MSHQCFRLSLSACFTTPLHQGSCFLHDDLDIFSFFSSFLHVCICVCLFLCVHINFVLHACLYPSSYQTRQRKSVSKEIKLEQTVTKALTQIFSYSFISRLFFPSTVQYLPYFCVGNLKFHHILCP